MSVSTGVNLETSIDRRYIEQKPKGQVSGAYMAVNPLDNQHLPGGIFTYPKDC